VTSEYVTITGVTPCGSCGQPLGTERGIPDGFTFRLDGTAWHRDCVPPSPPESDWSIDPHTGSANRISGNVPTRERPTE
jgi:hypothetical protein